MMKKCARCGGPSGEYVYCPQCWDIKTKEIYDAQRLMMEKKKRRQNARHKRRYPK